jgi:hypothetical protein
LLLILKSAIVMGLSEKEEKTPEVVPRGVYFRFGVVWTFPGF